jgi:hypothetical protein
VGSAHPTPQTGGALAATNAGYDPMVVARIFRASGLFPDIQSEAAAAAKLIVGRGLGLSDYDCMAGLHLVSGKVVLAANLMAAAVKRAGRYDYRADCTDERCEITFYQRDGAKWVTIGTTSFSMADAKRAGLDGGQNWRKHPRAMLFARCISMGYRQHCPDALGGAPVYVEQHGEMEIADDARTTVAPEAPAPRTTDREALPATTMTRRDNLADAGTDEFSAVEAEVAKTGEGKFGPWELVVLKTAEGPTFSTLNKRMAAQIRDAAENGARVRLTWERTKKGGLECKELVTLAETGDA